MREKIRVILESVIIAVLVSILCSSMIIMYAHNKRTGKFSGNPLDWSMDVWDGSSIGSEEYLADYGNRGLNSITIESAKSFIYFVEQVNSGNTFEGYTIYLNSNLDLGGYTISSIGNNENPFMGVFDGSYYTIMNANIKGSGLFGSTVNAVVKNVGLYNVNIDGETSYVGGLIGEAYNTDVENSFFRLGSVKGSFYVGGLIGLMDLEDRICSITSSFADATFEGYDVGGVIGKIRTNNHENALIKLEEVYYNADRVYVEIDNSSCYLQNKVMKPNRLTNFSNWDYGKDCKWVDYSYADNSTKLEFNWPILSKFVKVYTLGSCYENVVYNPVTGEVENVESLTEALQTVQGLKNAEINIIVNKVVLDQTVEIAGVNKLTINAVKDTVITRGENVGVLLASSDYSKIILGDTESSAKIVIDGNRSEVEAKNLKSDALIQANNLVVNQNVVLQNNVNNTGNGGALVLENLDNINLKGIQINNCSAEKGGAIYVTNEVANKNLSLGNINKITIDDSVVITNCTAEKGGAIYVEGNVNLVISDNIYGNNASLGKDIYFENKSTISLNKDLTNKLSIYINGLKPYEETGRTNFEYTTVCFGKNLENNIDKILLENEGLKTTSVLHDNCISAYKGTEYGITYNLNGGTHTNPETYTCVDNVVFTEATKPGYEFLGWKEVKSTQLLASNLEEDYASEITYGTLGNKEYEAVYSATYTGNSSFKVLFTSYGQDAYLTVGDIKNLTYISTNPYIFTFNFELTMDQGYQYDINDGLWLSTGAYFENEMSRINLSNCIINMSKVYGEQFKYNVECQIEFKADKYVDGTHKLYMLGTLAELTYDVARALTPVTIYEPNSNVKLDHSQHVDITQTSKSGVKYTDNIEVVFTINQPLDRRYNSVTGKYTYATYGTYKVEAYLVGVDTNTPITSTSTYTISLFNYDDDCTFKFNMSDLGKYYSEVQLYIKLYVGDVIEIKHTLDVANSRTGYSNFRFSCVSDYRISDTECYDYVVKQSNTNVMMWSVEAEEGYELRSNSFDVKGASYISISSDTGGYWTCRYYVSSLSAGAEIILTIKPGRQQEQGDGSSSATVEYITNIDEHVTFSWNSKPTTVNANSSAIFSWSMSPASGYEITSVVVEILSKNNFSYEEWEYSNLTSCSWAVPNASGSSGTPPFLTSSVKFSIKIVAQDVTYKYFRFTSYGTGYAVMQKDIELPETISIPSTYDGKNVVAIYGYEYDDVSTAFYSDDIKKVIIPSTVTFIGKYAFTGCKNLEEVIFADGKGSVTTIDKWAFDWCEKLSTFEIPATVQTIGEGAFCGCSSLTTVTIPKGTTSIGSRAFYHCISLTAINVDSNNANYVSVNGVLMTKDEKTIIAYPGGKPSTVRNPYTIPSNVTTITEYAFASADSLEYIVIPNTIKNFGKYAFAYCANIKKVVWNLKDLTWRDYKSNPNWFYRESDYTYPDLEVIVNTKLSALAFMGSRATHVTINKDVTEIGAGAFISCNIKYLYYDAKNAYINNTWVYSTEAGYEDYQLQAFNGISREYGVDVVIGPNVQIIPDEFMFHSYEYLDSYYDEDLDWSWSEWRTEYGVTSYWDYENTIDYLQLLNSLDMTNATSLLSIGAHAFSNCAKITSLYIPKSVIYIHTEAFIGCTGLLPENGGSVVFEDLNNWRCSDYFNNKALPLSDNATATTYLIDEYAKWEWFHSEYWFLSFNLSDDETYYTAMGSRSNEALTVLNLPDYYTEVHFSNILTLPVKGISYLSGYLPNVKTITIPNTYTSINLDGLTKLETVVFEEGSTMTTIGKYAFSGCSKLSSINLPTSITSIDDYAFYNALKMKELDLSGHTNLKYIRLRAFYYSGIESIKLPQSITSLGANVFQCSDIKEFTFEFEKITAVPEYFLSGCSNLTTLTVGENVTSVGRKSFAGCTNLTTLNWNARDASVTYNYYYDYNSFSGAGINSVGIDIYIGEKVQYIPSYFMHDEAVEWGYSSVTIHPRVKSINFDKATSLKEIRSRAFSNNSYDGEFIVNINTPNAVAIGHYAFYECVGLTKVSGNVSSIGENAFASCKTLDEVNLPNVKTISKYAFCECEELTNIRIDNIEVIDRYGLIGSSINYVYSSYGDWYNIYTYSASIAGSLGYMGGDTEDEARTLASAIKANNVSYEIVRKELYSFTEVYDGDTLIGYSISKGKDVNFLTTHTLPSSYLGLPVIEVAENGFKDLTTINSITIPDSVKVIRAGAFSGCTALWTIKFGASLERIESNAFYNVNTSTQVSNTLTIPASVKFIEAQAFKSAYFGYVTFNERNFWKAGDTILSYSDVRNYAQRYLLTTYVDCDWTRGNSYLVFTAINKSTSSNTVIGYSVAIEASYKNSIEEVIIPATYADLPVSEIIASGFKDCVKLKTIVLSSNLKSINSYAFQNCTLLTSINLTDVTLLGSSVFLGCTSLASVDLTNVSSMASYAFDGCTNLSNVNLTNNNVLTEINMGVFRNCTSLTTVELPDSVVLIKEYAFMNSGLTSFDTNKVPEIHKNAFEECKNIDTFTFNSSFKKFTGNRVSEGTLFANAVVNKVVFNNTQLTIIEASLFKNNTGIKEVEFIGGKIYDIAKEAFYGCTGLIKVTMSVYSGGNIYIRESAFKDCSNLEEVTLPDKLYIIDNNAFANTKLSKIINLLSDGSTQQNTLPSNLYTIGEYSFNNAALTSVIIPSSVKNLKVGAFYGCSKLESVKFDNTTFNSIESKVFMGCSSLSSVDISSSKVAYIRSSAFENCVKLSNFKAPATLNTIYDRVFYNCGFTELNFISTVTSYGTHVYANNLNLTKVNFTSYSDNSIEENMFENCTALTTIEAFGSIVKYVDSEAFKNCTNLKNIPEISTSMKIGINAFYLEGTLLNDTSYVMALQFGENISWYYTTSVYYTGGTASELSATSSGHDIAREIRSSRAGYYWYSEDLLDYVAIKEGGTTIGYAVRLKTKASNTSSSNSNITELTVPDIHQGLPVLEVYDNGFSYCTELETIILPKSIRKIGNYAFKGCYKLVIDLSEYLDLTYIGWSAFSDCNSLTSVYISSNVSYIGSQAFAECDNLAKIEVDEFNMDYFDHDNVALYSASGETLCQYAIATTKTEYIALSGVKYIDCYAFAWSKNLTKISAEDDFAGLEIIESYAFYRCFKLKYFNISRTSKLYSIGFYAFTDCDLREIVVPENVDNIYQYAYSGNKNASNIYYYARNCAIGDEYYSDNNVFKYVGVNCGIKVTFGAQVEIVPRYMFYPSSSYNDDSSPTISEVFPRVRYVTFEEGSVCKSIDDYAFRFLKQLYTVDLSNCTQLTSIGYNAFRGCNNLNTLKLPDSVESIGSYAFGWCYEIYNLNIPSSLMSIGIGAFDGCKNLSNVYFGENCYNWVVSGVTSLYSDDLSNSSTAAIFLTDTYRKNSWYKDHDYLRFDENIVYLKDGADYKNRATIEIPSMFNGFTITTIGTSGFIGMPNLTKVFLPSTITTINKEAFSGCSALNEIDLSNVTTISYLAFNGCKALASLDLAKITEIYYGAFKDCTGLTTVSLGSSFYRLNYQNVSNNKITDRSFANCSALTTINVSDDNRNYSSVDGVLYNKAKTELIMYPINKGGDRYELERFTSAISDYAFNGSKNVKTIILSNSLVRIGKYAFQGSSLTKLENLDSVVPWYYTQDASYTGGYKISSPASSLVGYLLSSVSYYFYRNDSSIFEFYGDYDTEYWSVGIKAEYRGYVTSIHIPSQSEELVYNSEYDCYEYVTKDVNSIEDFRDCTNLEYVYIPETVLYLYGTEAYINGSWGNYGAFEGCKKLKTVYFSNSIYLDWYSIENNIDNFKDCGTEAEGGMEVVFGKNVNTIGDNLFKNTTANLTKITIESGIETIGNYAFYNVTTLTTIDNFSVDDVGEYAFYGCSNLTNGNLKTTTIIRSYAFYGCTSFNEITIPRVNIIYSYAFANCTGITVLNIEGANNIYINAFYGCTNVTELTIGADVRSIQDSVFANMTRLKTINFNATNLDNYSSNTNIYLASSLPTTSNYNIGGEVLRGLGVNNKVFSNAGSLSDGITLNIGKNVKRIPANMFCPTTNGAQAPNIKEIIWESGSECTVIGNNAFRWLDNITSITIPESVKYIGDLAFYECLSVDTIYFNATNCNDLNYESYGDLNNWRPGNYAFHNVGKDIYDGTNGVEVIFGSTVTRIPGNLFYASGGGSQYSIRLTKVNVENASRVKEIGSYAFYTPVYLNELDIPANTLKIGPYAFYGATNLQRVDLGKALQTIEDSAFYNATSLTELIMPSTLKAIGNKSFYGASSLTELTIPESMQTFGSQAFYNALSVKTLNYKAISMPDLQSDILAFANLGNYTSGVTVNVDIAVATIPAYLFCSEENSPTYMPNIKYVVFAQNSNLTSIGAYAFRYCQSLVSINLQNCEKLTTIGSNAFRGCIYLEEIYIPKSVKTIENYAFAFNYRATKITFDAYKMDDLNRSNNAFSLAGQSHGNVDIVIGKNVSYIPSWLFISAVDYAYQIEFSENMSYSLTFGANAFRDLVNISELTIPTNAVAIKAYAFNNMTGLTTLNFNAIRMNDLTNADGNATMNNSSFSNIGKNTSGVSIYIGEDVTRIPANLFYSTDSTLYTPNIKRVEFLTTKLESRGVSSKAFNKLFYLTEVIGLENNNLERLGDYAFAGCYSLTEISLNSEIKNIGSNAFQNCKALTKDILADLDNVIRINAYAFSGCESLKTVTIPRAVTFIGNNAYADCISLETINYYATLENYDEIYTNSLPNLKALTANNRIFLNAGSSNGITFNIGNDVEDIPGYLFYDCTNLKVVNIETVCEIGAYAFYGCNLTSIRMMEGFWNATKTTTTGVTYNYENISINNNTAINILTKAEEKYPPSVYADYHLKNSATIAYILIDKDGKVVSKDEDGVAYSVKGARGLNYVNTLNIPSEYNGKPVTKIESYGFTGYDSIKTIIIPETITYIGYGAFANCKNLETVNYNAINSATYECLFHNSGENGFVLNIGENVEKVPDGLLDNTYERYDEEYGYTEYVTVASNVCEINFLGQKVTRIEDEAFSGCIRLTTLTIPSSVTYIGSDLFGLNYSSSDYYSIDFSEYQFQNITLKFLQTNNWIAKTYNYYGFEGGTYWDQESYDVYRINLLDLDPDFFNDDGTCIINTFIYWNSYYPSSYFHDCCWFERASNTITIKLDHGESAVNIRDLTNEVYYGRYTKKWYSDYELNNELDKVTVPINNAGLTFMGYFYNGSKVIDYDGSIIKHDISDIIDLNDFVSEYEFTAQWEEISFMLFTTDRIDTIVYASDDVIEFNTHLINGEGNILFDIYPDLEVTYKWYRGSYEIKDATENSFKHTSTLTDIGTYVYRCEIALMGMIMVSNEYEITITSALVDKPTLSYTSISYTGDEVCPEVVGFVEGAMYCFEIIDGNEVVIEDGCELTPRKNVGTYTVIIRLNNNYSWSYEEGTGYIRDDLELTWTIKGFKVTLAVDSTFKDGVLKYNNGAIEYSSNTNMNFFNMGPNTVTIKATADSGYGFYYYTIKGDKTNITEYNKIGSDTIEAQQGSASSIINAQFNLSNIKEDITITGYFVPTVTLKLAVNKQGGNNDLTLLSYENLITSAFYSEDSGSFNMVYEYTPINEGASATVFAEEHMVYIFDGKTAIIEDAENLAESYCVISTLQFNGYDLIDEATYDLENECICFISEITKKEQLIAGNEYNVIYNLIEVFTLEEIEYQNTVASIIAEPVNASDGVRIKGVMYTKSEASIGVSVTYIAEGYTFVGFKSGSDLVYLYNDNNLGFREEYGGVYKYSFNLKSNLKSLVVKNFVAENIINVKMTATNTLQLKHLETQLEYTLDNYGVNNENNIFVKMMQGTYSITGLINGTMTITVYDKNGQVIETKVYTKGQVAEFTIDDENVSVDITIQ